MVVMILGGALHVKVACQGTSTAHNDDGRTAGGEETEEWECGDESEQDRSSQPRGEAPSGKTRLRHATVLILAEKM